MSLLLFLYLASVFTFQLFSAFSFQLFHFWSANLDRRAQVLASLELPSELTLCATRQPLQFLNHGFSMFGMVRCYPLLASSQCLVRLLYLCWITDGYTDHPPIEGLLPPTGFEPTPFHDSASKVAGLQVHSTNLGSCPRTHKGKQYFGTV